MSLRYWFYSAAVALPAGAQPLASLVDEALHNNREILAAQKKYEAARPRPSQAASLPACQIRQCRSVTCRMAGRGQSPALGVRW